ncbi:hypothetical protein DPMN_049330 [Dreissena polymorpha]|uniref:Uncharacterized protein n=1 Tax=Dreissena polymorpha TaxID=45954 RepID=A0A9D4CE72_DREPO|nr:hypothetical protein DPMN_049330 [Dreissena polymorpha]
MWEGNTGVRLMWRGEHWCMANVGRGTLVYGSCGERNTGVWLMWGGEHWCMVYVERGTLVYSKCGEGNTLYLEALLDEYLRALLDELCSRSMVENGTGKVQQTRDDSQGPSCDARHMYTAGILSNKNDSLKKFFHSFLMPGVCALAKY